MKWKLKTNNVLRIIGKSFFITLLDLSLISLGQIELKITTINIIPSKCSCIDGPILKGMTQPVFCSFALY